VPVGYVVFSNIEAMVVAKLVYVVGEVTGDGAITLVYGVFIAV
jgi:hypothetical protein